MIKRILRFRTHEDEEGRYAGGALHLRQRGHANSRPDMRHSHQSTIACVEIVMVSYLFKIDTLAACPSSARGLEFSFGMDF